MQKIDSACEANSPKPTFSVQSTEDLKVKNLTNAANRFRVLIKFMDEEYVSSFMDDGLLFMRNIDYFRKCEDGDTAIRGDKHEGLAATFKTSEANIKIGEFLLKDAVGKIDLRYDHTEKVNVYCMTKISDQKLLEAGSAGLLLSEQFKTFGNRAILIGGSNIVEFERRLKTTVSKNATICTLGEDGVIAKQVTYVDRNEHHGRMGVFNKFSEYAWQHEWRIAFTQSESSPNYELKLGSLRDIAVVFETEHLISEPLRLSKSDSS